MSALAAPKLQLVYFGVRARAEAPRMILHYGGVPYTEETCQSFFGKPWGGPEGAKASGLAPFGQLPLLAVDGRVLGQTAAINRYCAALCPAALSLVPADPVDAAWCDGIFEAAQELSPVNPCVNAWRGEDFAAKKADFLANTLPPRLANLNKILEGDHGGPFTTGAEVRYCDFSVYHQFDLCRLLEPAVFDPLPAVRRFMGAVEALPGVTAYLAARSDCVDIGVQPMLRDKA
ncbi:glutathione S-transferase [Pavlovales sp. CCMP2436]|nr:glutathione S-transferase [Pavlovales sp. CCMP2436]